ncbi:MAG TPA: glycosyltransferase [Solirubrobacteraceae bacterium]|nr:glycosyltransferase [Solirubrobacteraceae bacterium]
MALRLTQTQLEPETAPDGTTAEDDLAVVSEANDIAAIAALAQRAAPLLAEGRSKEYLELFDEAGAIEHHQRRYYAQRVLLEQALVMAPQVNERRATTAYLAMATGAINVLEHTPAEPVLLNYAGVAFYELWSLDAARSLFQAAKRLDDKLPHIDRNLKELARRGRTQGPKRAPMHPALRALSARAAQVARRAKPAEGLTMTLCMIVRDEEEMLPRTLEAVRPAVDEIVIVDTGSQDDTIKIAESFGAKVIEREWTGSFSDARNVSFDAATGDWILYLDADEVLVRDDIQKLRELRGQTWREAFYLKETNYTGTEEAGAAVQHSALRVFRNRPEYRFRGRLHEQIAYALPSYLPERWQETSVRVDHYGYLGVVRDAKDKSRRNLEILQLQQRESQPTAFLHFNIGVEHSVLGEFEDALREFEEAWRLTDALSDTAQLEFLPSLASRTITALRQSGRQAEAIERAQQLLERFPGFTDLVYWSGLAAYDIGRQEDAIAFMERATQMGDGPSKYTALVGAGTYLPRIALAAIYINRQEPQKALETIEWCVENHPDFFGVLEPYALGLLRSGRSGAETVATIEERLGKLTKTQRFLLGTALYERGAAAEAEDQFRLVVAAQPHSGPARAALVESLLYQKRYREAADEAEQLPTSDPVARIVVRSELFARLLDHDLAGAERSLTRAAAAGLAPADRELFGVWLAHSRDQSLSAAPPPAALPLLELMLESLLRVHDFQNFESLLKLYERSGLSDRERRERMAQMYLRRGFIKSAGREWLAVCQEQPDVRALAGLAHVALANGQPETAHNFAVHALGLEPGNAVLQELVKRTSSAAAA